MIGGHCEVAQRLAERLGFGGGVITALGQNQERWDGRGLPSGVKGEALAPAVRVVHFARDMVVFAELSGEAGALAKAKARSGSAYDPRVVAAFAKRGREFMRGLDQLSSWNEVLDLEPKPRAQPVRGEFDAACLAMADFTDIKSPHTSGHSRAVGALAGEAARLCGLPQADCADVSRAGLVHDIGQTAISAAVWMKPAGPPRRNGSRCAFTPITASACFPGPLPWGGSVPSSASITSGSTAPATIAAGRRAG